LIGSASEKGSQTSTTQSAISQGTVEIKNEEKQLQLTGTTSQQTIAQLNRDTDNTHTALDKIDNEKIKQRVEANKIIKQAVFNEAVKFTDEAYKTLFIKNHPVSRVEIDQNGQPYLVELTPKEIAEIKPREDGKIHIALNGLFNDEVAAGEYASQHQTGGEGEQYIIHFPETDNALSELLLAGYVKHLENDFFGLSNSTAQLKGLALEHGQTGLHLDGHSRGGMTIGNMMESLARIDGNQRPLSATTINFFGSAYNVQEAANLLSTLADDSRYSNSEKQMIRVQYQSHYADTVSRLVGRNPTTGGSIPEGSNTLTEGINVLHGEKTTHNSYVTQQGLESAVDRGLGGELKAKLRLYSDSKVPELVPVSPIDKAINDD